MRKSIKVNTKGASIRIRLAAGYAGVGKVAAAKVFDSAGTHPEELKTLDFGNGWSGVDSDPAKLVDHIVYVQYNVASLMNHPELVSALVVAEQGGVKIDEFHSEPEVVDAAEVVIFKILLDVQEAASATGHA